MTVVRVLYWLYFPSTYCQLSRAKLLRVTWHEWPHANIEPQKLAKFGYFHHANNDEYNDLVECFACGNMRHGWRSERQACLSLLCTWRGLHVGGLILQETQSLVEPESRPTTPAPWPRLPLTTLVHDQPILENRGLRRLRRTRLVPSLPLTGNSISRASNFAASDIGGRGLMMALIALGRS